MDKTLMQRAALAISLFLLCALPSRAQVTFSVNGGAGNASAASSLTFSLAGITTGTNLWGKVCVTWTDINNATITGVTWATVSMTSAGAAKVGANHNWVQCFGLAAPGTGSPQIVVSFSAATSSNIHGDGITYTGVNQSTPVRAGSYGSSSGNSTTPQLVVTSQTNDRSTTCIITGDGSASTNQTLRTNDPSGAATTIADDDAAGASTVTHTWTISSAQWAIAGFSIAAAGVTSTKSVPMIN